MFRLQFDDPSIPLNGGIVLARLPVQERQLEVRGSETRRYFRSLLERPPGARRIAGTPELLEAPSKPVTLHR